VSIVRKKDADFLSDYTDGTLNGMPFKRRGCGLTDFHLCYVHLAYCGSECLGLRVRVSLNLGLADLDWTETMN
jgi:hypothetical protein